MEKTRKTLITICIILFMEFANLSSTVEASALPGDLGEPFSSFQKGTAKSLEGRTVVISMFLDTPSFTWTDKEMEKELPVMDSAFEYITLRAEEYGVECEFVYDWNVEPVMGSATADRAADSIKRDLFRKRRIKMDPEETKEFEYYLDDMLDIWKSGAVSYNRVLEKYDADNVFMIVFFKGDGRDYAITYDGEDSKQETLISYSSSGACTMAHEILHLFGAHDFYEGAEYTEDTTEYLKNEYKNDIMLKVDPPGKITKTVGAVTAYQLGWIDYCEDLAKYPQLKR